MMKFCWFFLSGLRALSSCLDHVVQVSCGAFNLEMFVLPCPAFRRQKSTTMYLLKIAVGELVSSLALFGLVPHHPGATLHTHACHAGV